MLHVASKTSLSHPRGPQSHSSNSTRNAQLERHIQYLSSTLPNSQLNLLDTTIYKACPGSGIPENFWNHFIFVCLKVNFVCLAITVRFLLALSNTIRSLHFCYYWRLDFVTVPGFAASFFLRLQSRGNFFSRSSQSHLHWWNLNCTSVQ